MATCKSPPAVSLCFREKTILQSVKIMMPRAGCDWKWVRSCRLKPAFRPQWNAGFSRQPRSAHPHLITPPRSSAWIGRLITVGAAPLWIVVAALPALAKTSAGIQTASLPGFSPPGGVFTNTLSVVLSAQSSGAVIRYTLDGSEPTNSSAVYSAPLQLAGSKIVKAKVFPADSAPGPTLSQIYALLEQYLCCFDSNLPLVILNTFGQDIPHTRKVS